MKPCTEHPLSSATLAAVETIRAALAVVAKLSPADQHRVRELLAEHLRALGTCEHSLAEEMQNGI